MSVATGFRKTRLSLAAGSLLLLTEGFFACKYNVRDVGFSDLGFESYRLLLFVDRQVTESRLEEMEALALAELMDTNIEQRIVRRDEPRDGELLSLMPEEVEEELPALVLVSPKGRTRVWAAAEDLEREGSSFWDAMEGLRGSPVREDLLSALVSSYCVVLLVEGSDSAQNETTHGVVDAAIQEAIRLMGHLPKSVDHPPRKVTVQREESSEEELLLWSLGISKTSSEGERRPAVAVVYGRGRVLEPVLLGSQIEQGRLLKLMSFVGQDCECDLDRDWILGLSLPLLWTQDHRAKAARLLGFDPENPMVRAEMRRILSSGLASARHLDEAVHGAQGYTEVVIELDEDQERDPPSSVSRSQGFAEGTSQTGEAPFYGLGNRLPVVAGVLSLALLAGGGIVLLISRRRPR